MNLKKSQRLLNVFGFLFLLCGVFSLAVFIPYIREMLIGFAELFLHREINHQLWNEKLLTFELSFLILFLPIVFVSFSKNYEKINSLFNSKVFAWSIIAFSFVLMIVSACMSKDIWLDETFSLGLARHNAKELISLTAKDVHPPLYYLFLRIAMILFPNSIGAAKIVSVVPLILIMIISLFFFSKNFTLHLTNIFNLLLASVYTVLLYSIEIRMYSWAMLFCMICLVSSYYMVKKGDFKYFLVYILSAECGAYTQYWTAVALAINFILVSALCFYNDKKSFKKILLSALIGIALFLPWLQVLLSQMSKTFDSYWIEPITFLTFVRYFLFITPLKGISKLLFLFFTLILFIASVRKIREGKTANTFSLVCLTTPVLLILSATLISFLFRPVFIERYAVPSIVFFIYFIVFSINTFFENETENKDLFTIKNAKTKIVCALEIIVLFSSVFNFVLLIRSEHKLSVEEKSFSKMMKENLRDDTVFIISKNAVEKSSHIPRCIAYSYPSYRIYNQEIPELWTSAYFYDRKNLINNIDNEKNLCLVLNTDEEVPNAPAINSFSTAKCEIESLSIYGKLKFCFLSK